MAKNGQITLFIVFGMFIILAVILVLVVPQKYSPGKEIKQTSVTASETAVINDFVTDCLEIVAGQGVRILALQGGYLNPKGDAKYNEPGDGVYLNTHFYFNNNALPFLYLEKQSRLRSLEIIKKKLANYIIVELQNCLNFNSFKEQNYVVKNPVVDGVGDLEEKQGVSVPYSPVKAKAVVDFSEDGVVVRLEYPLIFERGETIIASHGFSVFVPLRFKLLYAIADKLLRQQLDASFELNKHCAEFASLDKLVNIYVLTNLYDYDSVIQIIDAKPAVAGSELPFKFQFAVRNAKIEGECVG